MSRLSLNDRFINRARQIHANLQAQGGRVQVRWWHGLLLTYRFPAPRGYGVRGQLVAVYSEGAELRWIEEDLITFAQSLSDTSTPVCA